MFDPARGYPVVVPYLRHADPAAAVDWVIDAPTDQPWGLRQAIVADPGGHVWELSRHLREVPVSAWGAQQICELSG